MVFVPAVLIYSGQNCGYVNLTIQMISPFNYRDPKGTRREAAMKRLNIMVMTLAVFWFAGFAVSAAGAEIYAWTDEDGVKHFTNHAPPKQATLFMKTREIPHDEEADKQRSEMDRLEVARQELAEREAFLQEQQLAAERRIATANARADETLREADRILQDAQAASEDDNYRSSGIYGIGFVYPYYPYYRSPYRHKDQKRLDGNSYRNKYPAKHPLHNRYQRKDGIRSLYPLTGGRYSTHRSRTAIFRGRHGIW